MAPFPDIEPYAHGRLDVGDGQQIYWETCGNPSGVPALVLHGGPGSGCHPVYRRYFDPEVYRIVLLDQRGCGRSSPRVGALTDLTTNTTWHLVRDLERLRDDLGIDRWLVFGVSWGVTLGLVYAESYPQRVRALVLASITLTRPSDIHWLYHEAGRFVPSAWDRFRTHLPDELRHGDLIAGYYELLNIQSDGQRRADAAKSWCGWEDALLSLEPGWLPNPRYQDPAFRMTFARLVNHCFFHRAWLDDDQIVRDAGRLGDIPGLLVHGRLDLGSPAEVPWTLARAWPKSEMALFDAGHAGSSQTFDRIVAATTQFARLS